MIRPGPSVPARPPGEVRHQQPRLQLVRKSSWEALLILLEQDLILQHDLENKVCQILLELLAPDSDDEYSAEAMSVSLPANSCPGICKMASVLTRAQLRTCYSLGSVNCAAVGNSFKFSVRYQFWRYLSCHWTGSYREVFGINHVSTSVTKELHGRHSECYLIPKFSELCSDHVWGMRKACAECFVAASYNTSPEVRRTQLSPLFIGLVSDPCRWVHKAMFQSLGPFTFTFASPSKAT
ncbi:serine/threonine-protein phosphatase 4 regulatory subunit 1-like isoform X2 [Dipodomys merriami]|uniref:serine/threonine-protein phosphatase 4 regulatory subunit 1-like isoform X2 n=1 Tax=Dipodomys merriami TaxID=94247 RepID=UPI003855AFF5